MTFINSLGAVYVLELPQCHISACWHASSALHLITQSSAATLSKKRWRPLWDWCVCTILYWNWFVFLGDTGRRTSQTASFSHDSLSRENLRLQANGSASSTTTCFYNVCVCVRACACCVLYDETRKDVIGAEYDTLREERSRGGNEYG